MELDVDLPPPVTAEAVTAAAARDGVAKSVTAPGSCMRPLLGFVPQVCKQAEGLAARDPSSLPPRWLLQLDVMSRDATVRQIVQHAALTRLPAAWSTQRKRDHVAHVRSRIAHVSAILQCTHLPPHR